MSFIKTNDRQNTNSVKWDGLKEKFSVEDNDGYIPMWIADSDFKCPQEVVHVIEEKAKEGIYGYTIKPEKLYTSVINWLDNYYDFNIQKDWITFTPGVIAGYTLAIQSLTNEGNGIIIQEPVYYPFKTSILDNNRKVVVNTLLKDENNKYSIDFKDLEKQAKDPNNKMMILCSPHNPVGKVWSRDDLKKIVDICYENDIIIISDEAHADLIMPGYKHISTADISEKAREITISTYSPSKSFNLAGLQTAYMVTPSDILRKEIEKQIKANRIFNISYFGGIAVETAYMQCRYYVDDFIKLIYSNYQYIIRFVEERMPELVVSDLEGTYLLWIDFSRVEEDYKVLEERIINNAKVIPDLGSWFGKSGRGFLRFNLATDRENIEKAFNNIYSEFNYI